MQYSSSFLGWIGELAKDATYSNFHTLSLKLIPYFKRVSSPGQKLVIGYDSRFLARELATYIACTAAAYGVKVFLSNRIVPSAVLLQSSLQKKSLGTIVLTGDDMNAKFLGLRVFDSQGHFLSESSLAEIDPIKKKKPLTESTASKWIAKGYIEPFDPTICFENHLNKVTDFDAVIPFPHRIMFNPLHGSGIYYFDRLLSRKQICGYTVNHMPTPDLSGLEPSPSLHVPRMISDMASKNAELGFIVSPDCSTFEFIAENRRLEIKEVVQLLVPHLYRKGRLGRILLANELDLLLELSLPTQIEVSNVDKTDFQEAHRAELFDLAIDHMGRFYFNEHGAPDALMVGYYLTELFGETLLETASSRQDMTDVE